MTGRHSRAGIIRELLRWAEVTVKGRRRLNNIPVLWLVDQLSKCAAMRGVIEVFSESDRVWQVKFHQIFLHQPVLLRESCLRRAKALTYSFAISGELWISLKWRGRPVLSLLKITSIFSTKSGGKVTIKFLRENITRLFFSWSGFERSKYFTFRGQYAVVKQCKEKSTEKEFAAKFVRKRRKGKDCRAEVWHEVEVLSATNNPYQHPQIITLYDVFETRSEIILILELWVNFFLTGSAILLCNLFKGECIVLWCLCLTQQRTRRRSTSTLYSLRYRRTCFQ